MLETYTLYCSWECHISTDCVGETNSCFNFWEGKSLYDCSDRLAEEKEDGFFSSFASHRILDICFCMHEMTMLIMQFCCKLTLGTRDLWPLHDFVIVGAQTKNGA